jgi:hypothetical protein
VKCALPISLAVLFTATAYSQVEPNELVRESIANYERDWRAAQLGWTYTQTDVTRSDDKKEIEVSEVAPLEGTPYERLVRKDGRPLTPAEQRKEDRKYEATLRQRQKETPSERKARIRKYENDRAFVKEVPEAYNFRLTGEEAIDGRPAWVIEMTPRAGFMPSSHHAAMLEHIEGKLWIDKEDIQWAKAEAHVTDTISIGWILARIEPDARFTVEQTRVANGLWMPQRITINGAAHVMLIHSKVIHEELTYSGYRKDGADSADGRPAANQAAPHSDSLH